MAQRFTLLPVIALLLASGAIASTESQRYMRNAVHFYELGRYDKAKGYFKALLSEGTSQEKKVARKYLALPEMQDAPIAPVVKSHETAAERHIRRTLEKSIIDYEGGRYSTAAKGFLEVSNHGNSAQREVAQRYLSESAMQRLEVQDEDSELSNRAESPVASASQPLHVSGYFREELAARFSPPIQASKLRSVGYMAITGQYSDEISYKISGRLWYDAVYSATRHYPAAVAEDQKTDAMLRDTYIDVSKGNWDVRAGKQQIVWGESVGLFYADVVNAKDMREFILPDFDFIRIPDWSIDTEYSYQNLHAEGVWLPWPVMSRYARSGAEFVFPLALPPHTPVAFAPAQSPANTLANGEVGGRLSYRLEGWDFGVFHLRTWDKQPVFQRTLTPGLAVFTETHPRLTVDGATLAKEIDPFVLKAEWTYTGKKQFQTTDLSDPDGLKTKDYMDYMVSADYSFANKIESTFQIGQRLVRAYESDLFQQHARQTQLTIWLRRAYLDNHLTPEIVLIKDLGTTDMLLRPKTTYKFHEHWKLTVGLDIFSGPSEGLFGEFARHNRGYTELQFDF